MVVNKADDKFATAHDLRRSLYPMGTSGKAGNAPTTMRHADIGTTMKYYVAQDAADVADELWAGSARKRATNLKTATLAATLAKKRRK